MQQSESIAASITVGANMPATSWRLRIAQITALITLCITLHFAALPLMSEAQAAEPAEKLFNITPDDAEFLRYLLYQLETPTGNLTMQIGELRLKTVDSLMRINIAEKPAFNLVRPLQDSSGKVVQVDLLEQSRSEKFELPPTGPMQMQFFRTFQKNSAPTLNKGRGAEARAAQPDSIEWEVQLRDAESSAVLQILHRDRIDYSGDESGVYKTSDPHTTAYQFELSPEYNGRVVYVQIVPRRWGTDDGGSMVLRHQNNRFVNHSALVDSEGDLLPDSLLARLESQWFDAVIAYCDATKLRTGWLPVFRDHWNFSPSQSARFTRRYSIAQVANRPAAEQQSQASDSSALPSVFQNFSTGVQESEQQQAIGPSFKINIVKPNPIVAGERCRAGLTLTYDSHLLLVLHASDGWKLETVWTGHLVRGYHEVALHFHDDYAAGDYALFLVTREGTLVDQYRIAIE